MKKRRTNTETTTDSELENNERNNPLPPNNKIKIFRPVYTQHEFDLNHGGKYEEKSFSTIMTETLKKMKNKYIGLDVAKKMFFSKFPFIDTLRMYKWKTWLILDIIAGLIVGTMQVPQSFAYAQLAGIQPIYGLYLAFFPVMIYMLLGSSRHISVGTMAIISLMSGNFLEQSLIDFPLSTNSSILNISMSEVTEMNKAKRVAGFTLCVGVSQLIMGIFNLGFLTKYLPDTLISGFTVASAVIVFSTQLKYCFGVKIPRYYGLFSVWKTFASVLGKLPQTNIPTLVITVICIVLLILTKEFVNPIVTKKIHVPIPIELIIVIIGTVSSRYLNLNERYNVSIVGFIPSGVPAPVLPETTNSLNYISNIIVTSIIIYSISISLAKMFAKKNGYKINPTQEFFAYGIMNIFSSFFYCFPSCGSVSRTAVQESVGGKSQMASMVTAILILFILLFIGPLFQYLPNCILASIILVALKSMLLKFLELKELWLFSIWDFSVWVVTFLCTIFLDVQYGLIAGVTLSTISIALRTQSPNSHILGQIEGTDIYKNVAVYADCNEIPGIKIFRYEGSLYYACKDHFINSLYSKVFYDPVMVKFKMKKLTKKIDKYNQSSKIRRASIQEELDGLLNPNLHHIIIDCSTWGYIDIVGVKILHEVIQEFKNVNISVLLANPKTDVRRMFYKIESSGLIDDESIFVSVHDAVINSLYNHKLGVDYL